MNKQFEQKVLDNISLVPGLVGLSSLDFMNDAKKLNTNNLKAGTSYEETSKGNIIRVAIFINKNVRAKLICTQIHSTIVQLFKKSNKKLNKVIIYVMGII
ncbi:hypothetical protein [Candidatus Mycoplasma mahonii]|uniref:hypothetical protein n=1 Tax=Candidatus Mycoplasma mahonii TaxID=3004105 RepID=UPI0026F01BDB|nr:hypothetical protein [Candidatus Mycoplasma mahonii]WKX02723.1 hypothetical protein O3I44_01445 [Candidatus Mycoplasma mahonii]